MRVSIGMFVFLLLLVGLKVSAREFHNFNDGWFFKKGPFNQDASMLSSNVMEGKWLKVNIPHTWNAHDMQQAMANISAFRNPQERFYTGEAFYKKSFFVAESQVDKRTFISFEGVGSVAEVYVNNRFAGRHKGAYSAFAFEISRLLKYGQENEIVVKVDNSPRPDVVPVNNVLFGVYGGIYRDVKLIVTSKINIAVTDYASPGVYIRQETPVSGDAKAFVSVKVENKFASPQDIELNTTIYDRTGKRVAQQNRNVTVGVQGRQVFSNTVKMKNPRRWQGVFDPYLYKCVTRLLQDGVVLDEVVQPLGFRHFEFRNHQGMFLNGKKYQMYGVCRHQDWLGKGSALTTEEHDADMAIIKEMGATTIRLAHYQQADYIYSKCDSIGLLVWAEIPFVNQVTTFEGENAKQQMTELIRQNYNHPSIFIWGLHNEVYTPFEQTIPLTEALHDLAKREDPDRYTVSVSGYNAIDATANNTADIQGINHYFGWYGGRIGDVEKWVKQVEKEFPNHKVIFSEYGGEANIFQQKENVTDIGDCCGYDKMYYETWGTKFHEVHWGVIAKHPYLLASYVWNMFDFATPMSAQGGIYARNMKGLVTFDRKVKKDGFYWYKANWSQEPVVYLTQRRNYNRENEITDITVYSNIGLPTVILNGEEVVGFVKGTTDVHYIYKGVRLNVGENIIEAKAMKNGKEYIDSIVWHYSPENMGTNMNSPEERKGLHIGL